MNCAVNQPILTADIRPTRTRVFSGESSRDMWARINEARTVRELREALYLVCCRLQELESAIGKGAP